jgi:ferredoxin
MAKRKIIEIDRDACDGCGLCTTACMEGALEIDAEKKAVLVKEIFCDGLGACLDVCPTGALKIIERETAGYDPKATFQHVMKTRGKDAAKQVHGAEIPGCAPVPHAHGGCHGSRALEIDRSVNEAPGKAVSGRSELGQWPVQLHLVSPMAPYFRNADLLVAADCTAFALGSFHADLLKGKKLVIACPKLDNPSGYIEKLAELIQLNDLHSLTVAIMSVPCCSGLYHMVDEAVEQSGVQIFAKKVVVGVDGRIVA